MAASKKKAAASKAPARKAGATKKPSPSIRGFKTQKDFAAWLEKNLQRSEGLWLRIAKKGSGKKSVTYPEAVETALCHGWIDGQKKPESETAWLQKFTPRRPRSPWSRINKDKALDLIARGKMKPGGHAEVERAKLDGRWDSAYDPSSTVQVPDDLQQELHRRPRAAEFFNSLNRANRYAVLWRIQTAKKPETRAQRLRSIVEMLEKGEKFH
jgi:uncharacterized protein YdeI (YjbR/CyaY-like superfamily)